MTNNSRTHGCRAVIAVVLFTAVAAACSLSSSPLAEDYACNYSSHPTQGQTINDVAGATYHVGDGTLEWKELVRDRNQYAGADDAKLDPNREILIPRKCAKGEKPAPPPSNVVPTSVVIPLAPPGG